MKKLVIIGGSGFAGKSLKDYLKNKNFKVFSFSKKENKNILNFKKLPKCDYIIYCINNIKISKSLKIFNHFKKLLNKDFKKVKILYFSSGAVYGQNFNKKRFKENEKVSLKNIDKLEGYKKSYSKEKIKLEKEFKKMALIGYKVSIVRGFAFYGKHILKYKYLISEVINSIKANKKIYINNDKIFRSYMHADDMCKWLLKIVNNSTTECPIFNIGSEKIINIKNLANYLNKNYNAKITFKKGLNKKIDFYVPSTFLARKKLKLKNTINFNRAIKLLIN